jgi:hypothetical protein
VTQGVNALSFQLKTEREPCSKTSYSYVFLNRTIGNAKAEYLSDEWNSLSSYFSLDHTFGLRLIQTSINELFREFSGLEKFHSENCRTSSYIVFDCWSWLLLSWNLHNLTQISLSLHRHLFIFFFNPGIVLRIYSLVKGSYWKQCQMLYVIVAISLWMSNNAILGLM